MLFADWHVCCSHTSGGVLKNVFGKSLLSMLYLVHSFTLGGTNEKHPFNLKKHSVHDYNVSRKDFSIIFIHGKKTKSRSRLAGADFHRFRSLHLSLSCAWKTLPSGSPFNREYGYPRLLTVASSKPWDRFGWIQTNVGKPINVINHPPVITWLVVLTILKNMKVHGKDYPIYYGK